MNWLTAEKPLLIGHRGASADLPENSLGAFKLAVAQGADGVEFDVQLAADGVVVVVHDDTLDRTTTRHGRVSALTLAEIRQGRMWDGQTVPTLAEVFATLGDKTLYNIELKEFGWRRTGLDTAVADLIRQYNLAEQCLISSFNPRLLQYARQSMPPQTPLALLRAAGMAQYTYPFFRGGQAEHPENRLVDEAYMGWAHGRGYRVHVWTVDDPEEAARLIGLGVHGIITNKPAFLRQALHL
jgi:glycerophosphoryl diester phosphodiesterase